MEAFTENLRFFFLFFPTLWGGSGVWLMETHGSTAAEACEAIAREAAAAPGINRRPDPVKLAHLVAAGSMAGLKK